MKSQLHNEILMNFVEIKGRLKILSHLIFRAILNSGGPKRTVDAALSEYEDCWKNFWEQKDYYFLNSKKNNIFNNNGIDMKEFSFFDFKCEVIIKILTDKIKQFNVKTVLEIGSGVGLNLLILAPLFPDVKFYGLELTSSGVMISEKFIKSPPQNLLKRISLE